MDESIKIKLLETILNSNSNIYGINFNLNKNEYTNYNVSLEKDIKHKIRDVVEGLGDIYVFVNYSNDLKEKDIDYSSKKFNKFKEKLVNKINDLFLKENKDIWDETASWGHCHTKSDYIESDKLKVLFTKLNKEIAEINNDLKHKGLFFEILSLSIDFDKIPSLIKYGSVFTIYDSLEELKKEYNSKMEIKIKEKDIYNFKKNLTKFILEENEKNIMLDYSEVEFEWSFLKRIIEDELLLEYEIIYINNNDEINKYLLIRKEVDYE